MYVINFAAPERGRFLSRGLVDMSNDEDDRARLRLKMRFTVGITFAAGLGVPSRTTKQAARSSIDQGGGKRRCAVGIKSGPMHGV